MANKYTFKEVRNGIPVFREVNPLGSKPVFNQCVKIHISKDTSDISNIESAAALWHKNYLSPWQEAENSLREYEAHETAYFDGLTENEIEVNAEINDDGEQCYDRIEIGDTVTADIHEGKLINLKLVPQKFPIQPSDEPRFNYSARRPDPSGQ